MSDNNDKKLFIEEDCNVYEKIIEGGEIIFKNDKGEEVIRYKFAPYHSIYNKNATDDEKIDNLEVFHFHKIDNCFFDLDPEEVSYKENVHKGYMTASFCYLILQLLQDDALSKVDFEINLVNRAMIKNNSDSTLVQRKDIYENILSYPKNKCNDYKDLKNFDPMAEEDQFRLFLSTQKKADIDHYEECWNNLNKDKMYEIKIYKRNI
ncbi:hypothetical protein U9F96_02735 [Streptococcus salivarius]|uniref:hypothetical protein n=1 Tax=Streptococcus salivarius TaxID=1304 RepID=UPI0035C70F45